MGIFFALRKMHPSDFSPLSVVDFGEDVLINLIRIKTGLGLRDQICDKTQLQYLIRYLTSDQVDAQTMVVEDEYVDRSFLEDFAEYYARCFTDHPKKCCRVHFFKSKFDLHSFMEILQGGIDDDLKELNRNYIGHIVIRPIKDTFLARVCVAPYAEMLNSNEYKLITGKHRASLFGIDLDVTTAAFLEQDKVVSACATSAVWALLSASGLYPPGAIPSPSAITKAAIPSKDDGSRTFPNNGLTPIQVSRALKSFGLEPTVLTLDCNLHGIELLKEVCSAYISNDVPILIGGTVYSIDAVSRTLTPLGPHFVCALGYHNSKSQVLKDDAKQNLKAHSIDRIYAHDDRYGPFVRLNTTPKSFQISDTALDREETPSICGFELFLYEELKDVLVPEVLIIGLYHKIRIPYSHIRTVCGSLFHVIDAVHELMSRPEEFADQSVIFDQGREGEVLREAVSATSKTILDGIWDISLTTGSSIKKQVLEAQGTPHFSYNGVPDKVTFLTKNTPRYLWVCRISSQNGDLLTDILFDATEVPQGHVMIGYITYRTEVEQFWLQVDNLIDEGTWRTISRNVLEAEERAKFDACISNFFIGKGYKSNYLNALYGPLRIPTRKLKTGEVDDFRNVERRQDVTTVRRGNNFRNAVSLDESKRYIWVINEFGDLVFGEDIQEQDGKGQGHPTLVDGKPARLGGELFFKEGTWRACLKSGAYSRHIKRGDASESIFLNTVIEENFAGLSVQPDIG